MGCTSIIPFISLVYFDYLLKLYAILCYASSLVTFRGGEMKKQPNQWETIEDVEKGLRALADPSEAEKFAAFFKTEPGGYGEGDKFLGIRMPALRNSVPLGKDLSLDDIPALLSSPMHEIRMFALLLWVAAYGKAEASVKEKIFQSYLDNTRFVNNWDLVDASSTAIVGEHLLKREKKLLYRLMASNSMWERRIAMVSSLRFIREKEYEDALRLADLASLDTEALMHKAAGWMLREVGKRDMPTLKKFLAPRCRVLPRVLLRYSLEHFSAEERKAYLDGKPPAI